MDELPPLPYSDNIRKRVDDEWVYSTDQDFANPEKFGWERVFSPEQMRAYAGQAARLARIDMADICADKWGKRVELAVARERERCASILQQALQPGSDVRVSDLLAEIRLGEPPTDYWRAMKAMGEEL